jgi:hypothetical protein
VAPSHSYRCFHELEGECLNPLVRGSASDEKCASCAHYRGPMRGLGDVVAAVTEATGVARVVKAVHPNCKCLERRAALNAAAPFPDKPNG